MKSIRLRLFFIVALVSAIPVFTPVASMEQAATPSAAKKSVELREIIGWKAVSTTAISNDGEWFAYRIAPQEGDAELTVRNIASGKETKFTLGEVGAPGGRGGAPAGGGSLQFSDDSKWIAFTTTPSKAEATRLRRQRRPIQSSLTVLNLASGEKKEYSNIRRFAFAGDAGTHIAMHRAPVPAAGGASAARAAAPGGPAPGGSGAESSRPRGTDLIIRELSSGDELNVGNVSEFAFDRDGKFLATVMDAADKIGNGVQLRSMTAGTVRPLDTDTASYERLTWTEKGDGLTVLKGTEDKAYTDKMYSVLGFTGFGSGAPKKTVFDPSKDKSFPEGFSISGNRRAGAEEDHDRRERRVGEEVTSAPGPDLQVSAHGPFRAGLVSTGLPFFTRPTTDSATRMVRTAAKM